MALVLPLALVTEAFSSSELLLWLWPSLQLVLLSSTVLLSWFTLCFFLALTSSYITLMMLYLVYCKAIMNKKSIIYIIDRALTCLVTSQLELRLCGFSTWSCFLLSVAVSWKWFWSQKSSMVGRFPPASRQVGTYQESRKHVGQKTQNVVLMMVTKMAIVKARETKHLILRFLLLRWWTLIKVEHPQERLQFTINKNIHLSNLQHLYSSLLILLVSLLL